MDYRSLLSYVLAITFITAVVMLTLVAFKPVIQADEERRANEIRQSSTAKIRGSLTYPSNKIPDDLEVCAVNLETKQKFCTEEQIDSDEFVFDKGYEVTVEPGQYNIYAVEQTGNSFPAYHNEYINEFLRLGEWVDYDTTKCSDYLPKSLSVDYGETLQDIVLGDWYFSGNC